MTTLDVFGLGFEVSISFRDDMTRGSVWSYSVGRVVLCLALG